MMNRLTPAQQDRASGCLLGLAIGDALGATLEFEARDTRPVIRDLVGGGPFDLAPGQWTDDPAMALCLADSLIAHKGLDTDDLMRRFVNWWRYGENSCTGQCFDIGIATLNALSLFERTGTLASESGDDDRQAGNGTLMRLAPVAIFAAPDIAKAVDLAVAQSRTTHAAPVAHDACAYFASLLVEAILGADKEALLAPRVFEGRAEIADIAAGSWRSKNRDQISSSGYVVHTLEASLWCVHRAASFEEAVILAANLADDADTVAAVTGQLAGAIYGVEAIPQKWREKIAWRGKLTTLSMRLYSVGGSYHVGERVYFWTGRGSQGHATIREVRGEHFLLNPEPDAVKGSDYRERLHLGRDYWAPRDRGVLVYQINTPPQVWWTNF